MELRILLLVVFLSALAVAPAHAGIPKCCIRTRRDIPFGILMKVTRWDVQQGNGACDIPALVLHVRGLAKPVCAHLKDKRTMMWLRSNMKQYKRKSVYRDERR